MRFTEFWPSGRPAALPSAAVLALLAVVAGCSEPRRTAAPQPAGPVQSGPARNWADYKVAFARRLVAANPGISYTGEVPQTLLAIPVLEVELNADGSIRKVGVLRQPSQALDTTQIAIDAVRRAGPFGSVAHLPQPWRLTETFLFDDDRRFKPRTLDED